MAKESIDMTTLSNWSTITSGIHNVTLIAKADGYADSLPSTPVNFTKQSPTTYEQTGSTVRITNANYKQTGGTLKLL